MKTEGNALTRFLQRKNIVFSAKRYGIDALGAMAQGLFASLLIGTIIATLGEQAGIPFLVTAGSYAKAVSGPAMAISIGYALQAPWYSFLCWQSVRQPMNLEEQVVLWLFSLLPSLPQNPERPFPKRPKSIFWPLRL